MKFLSDRWHRFEMEEATLALANMKKRLSEVLKGIREQEARYNYHKSKLRNKK